MPSLRKRPSRSVTGDAGVEWVGGRLPAPFYVMEGEPHRPEMVVWLQLPDGIIVAPEVIAPRDDPSMGLALRRAMKSTRVSPRRIRVADERLASEVRAVFGDRLDVLVAPTPEVAALFAELASFSSNGDSAASYFEGGRIEEGTLARMFVAAETLYRAAPWKVAHDAKVLRMDIPALGVEGACVSILGKLGECFGLLVFPSLVAFERLLEAGPDGPPRSPAHEIDLGSSILSLDFERGADLPAAMRAEIARHGWSVAGPRAYPVVMRRDRDGVPAPVDERDVRIAAECAFAVAGFFVRHRAVFEDRRSEPVSESSATGDGGVTVCLTAPYEAHADFHTAPELSSGGPAATPSGAARVGRNDPCPCGSGKKYKKCCHAREETTRGDARRVAGQHELDRRLVDSIHRFSLRRFGDAWRDAVTDIFDLIGDDAAASQIVAPWAAYSLDIDGQPAIESFVAERRRQLSPAELSWIEAQREAWLSVLEVTECEPGVGVAVRDLLTGDVWRVKEIAASRTLVRRDAVLGRVVTEGEVAVFCGMYPRFLPPDAAADIVQRARRRLRSKGAVPASRLRSSALGRALIGWWAEAIEGLDANAGPLLALVNTDGDPLLLTTDHFTFDAGARADVDARLRTIERIEPPDDDDPEGEYTFAKSGNAMHAHWDNTIVGHARFAEGELCVESNSVARADHLRPLVEKACDGLLRFRGREHADPLSSAAERSPRLPVDDEPQRPEELESLLAYKQAHYRSWIDQAIPALGGKTPREASRTAPGRKRVDLLLRTFENHEARAAAQGSFDFAEVRKELGLPALESE